MRSTLLVAGFVVALSVPALAQTTVKFQQGTNGYSGAMDTYIDGIAPNDTQWYGNNDRIEIRSWSGTPGEKMNILIMFDVSSLPSNATVTSAKLTMYSTRARGQNGDVPVVEKVTSAWNNQYSWNMGLPTVVAAPGVTCPPIDSSYVDEPLTTPPNAPQVYTITGLASLVQGWRASPGTNYGIMISATTDINFRFASSEYATTTVRPELEVTYTIPGSGTPPTVSVTSPPTSTTSSPITVSGTASAVSPATVTSVTWSNALTGATGTASGTTSWSATIALLTGSNVITITVTDSYGLTSTSTFTVNKVAPSASGSSGSGKGDKKYCGMGVAEGSASSLAVGALALALLLAAMSRRS